MTRVTQYQKQFDEEDFGDDDDYYHCWDYDDYDDFGLAGKGGGGGSSSASKTSQKMKKRQNQRGGSGGRGTIYSNKHVRAKEALRTKR